MIMKIHYNFYDYYQHHSIIVQYNKDHQDVDRWHLGDSWHCGIMIQHDHDHDMIITHITGDSWHCGILSSSEEMGNTLSQSGQGSNVHHGSGDDDGNVVFL